MTTATATTIIRQRPERMPTTVELLEPSTPDLSNFNLGMIIHFNPEKVPRSSLRSPPSTTRLITHINNYLALKYYQYEVTYGLYVMSLGEKVVVNLIVLRLFSLVLYGLHCVVQLYVTRMIS